MTTIYHNPRCTKSRETLAILEEKNEDIKIVRYLDTLFTEQELSKVISLLNISPIDLVRKNEAVWKEKFKGKSFADNELIKIMVDNPKLIERPIVIKNNKAIIGRPPQNVIDIL